MIDSSTLQLAYVFTSQPNPILASVAGENPNTVDLNVLVNNPGQSTVILSKVEIDIPIGSDDAGTLSSATNLPAPDNIVGVGWTVATSNGSVSLIPPAAGVEGQALTFTLPGIAVNTQPGYVPFTITEFSEAGKTIDDTSYGMVKFASDFPITNFYAEPALVTNLDETVTLYWECSAQGASYVYSVHSDSWQAKDCLNAGECYSCSDGANGVVTPALSQQTTFSLDVITVDNNGNRKISQTLTTTVPVPVPSVSQNSYQVSCFGGRIVTLYWLAYNAVSCTVSLDGTILAENLPTDTYEQGYRVSLLGAGPGAHQLTVTAYAQSGPAQATFSFPLLNLRAALTSIKVGQSPQAIAITPNGQLALVVNQDDLSVSVIDIAGQTIEAKSIAVGAYPTSIAVSPDGTLALVTNLGDNTVTVIDIASRSAEASTIPVGQYPRGVAITTDGTLAFVTDMGDGTGTVIDIASRNAEAEAPFIGLGASGIAMTPDGTLALVLIHNPPSVGAMDIANRYPYVWSGCDVDVFPASIAITPDGTLALVTNDQSDTVTVIDIASGKPTDTIPVGTNPQGIAITPDGSLALVTNRGLNSVSVIDIAARTALNDVLSVGQSPVGIAITPDGTTALVVNANDGTVAVI